MDETTGFPAVQPRKWWVRALFMLLMVIAFHVAAWVLVIDAVLQLVLSAVTDGTNERLRVLGRGVGRYLGQIAQFVSFATEEVPFPFSDWPSGAAG